MRCGIRTELSGVTQQQYDEMHALFGPLAGAAKGFVAHIAGPSNGGWYMLEVWESKADHQNFMQEQVIPKLPPNAPQMRTEEFDVYSRQTKDQLNA